MRGRKFLNKNFLENNLLAYFPFNYGYRDESINRLHSLNNGCELGDDLSNDARSKSLEVNDRQQYINIKDINLNKDVELFLGNEFSVYFNIHFKNEANARKSCRILRAKNSTGHEPISIFSSFNSFTINGKYMYVNIGAWIDSLTFNFNSISSTVTLYINGVFRDTMEVALNHFNSHLQYLRFANNDVNMHPDITFDNILLFNKCLTEREILLIHNLNIK